MKNWKESTRERLINNSNFTPHHPFLKPVLFLIFNRLDTTKEVFAQIRKAKPPRLYIAADGPRKNVLGEKEKVKKVREYVLNNIDWKCEVKTLFREKNLGCKYAVSGAIDWFFENEEMGIILEDDTVPSQSFFWFCEELLERYKDDERVGMISGNNFFYQNRDIYSYHFSKHGLIWGWASWKRAWQKYDRELHIYTQIKNTYLFDFIFNNDKIEITLWKERLDDIIYGRLNTWDFQWNFTRRFYNLLTIRPSINLVKNIGFHKEASHTKGKPKKEFLTCYEISFPLKHPPAVVRHIIADNVIDKIHKKSLKQKLKRLLFRFFKKVLVR